jgi:hypothetical protein
LNINRTGGLSPFTYQWSPTTGLSNPAIINPLATPLATTTYYVTVTDYLGTKAYSNVQVTVNPVLPVSVTIAASANPSPPGNYVTFTATPVNGGTTPAYQWKVNGGDVGTGLPTYSYVPNYNDQVTCVMTSNYMCPSGNPATSNTITMIVVPVNTTVTGTVPSPLHLCFDASNTITVAGGGSTFVVHPGAVVNLIAGVKIRMLYGTTVQPGAYLHGWITLWNHYCGSLPPAMVAVTTGTDDEEFIPAGSASLQFMLWPNPARDQFTLATRGETPAGQVQVDIYDMRGAHVFSSTYEGTRSHEFMVDGMSPGLYFVRVLNGGQAETLKLVLTR